MVRLQVKKRYHNRRGLLAFLQATFPGCRNFRINEVKDGYYTFEAPRDLTEVKSSAHQAVRVLLTPAG